MAKKINLAKNDNHGNHQQRNGGGWRAIENSVSGIGNQRA